jgi:hypothetical protein
VEQVKVIAEDAPVLEIGQKYVVFLYHPGRGGGYNTQGNYFYVTGASQGVYEESSESDGESGYVLTRQSADGATLTQEELIAQIATVEASNIPHRTRMEIFSENIAKNLESGFISAEEYDQLLEDAQTYAQIID